MGGARGQATALNNLALLLRDMSRRTEALPLFERALQMMDTVPQLGARAPPVQRDVRGGKHLLSDGPASALALAHVAGPAHRTTVMAVMNLGALHFDMRAFELAAPLYERVLAWTKAAGTEGQAGQAHRRAAARPAPAFS